MSLSRFKADVLDLAAADLRSGRMPRRDFLKVAAWAGAAGAALPLAARSALAAANEIVVANHGGDAVRFMSEAWGAPFTEATGIPVSVEGGSPYEGNIIAMVDAGNVIWDVADTDGFSAINLGRQNYLEPIDYSVVDRNQLREGFAWEHGVANYAYSFVLAYDTTRFGDNPPRSWADFFNTADFPGKRSMWKFMMGMPEAALMGDGVAHDAVYPVDMDRAIAKVRGLGDDLILWNSGAESQQMLLDGEVSMAAIWHTRAQVLHRDTDGRITWTWNDGVYGPAAWIVPRGNPAGADVQRFIASTLDPAGQIALLRTLGNGPSNPQASAQLPDDLKALDPGYGPNLDVQLVRDEQWYADHYDEALNLWIDALSA